MPRRLLIIGCPGSGKSTLARRLAEKTGLPLVHLDALYWLPGWTARNRDDFDALLEEALQKPEWIIDGNYTRTLSRRLEFCDAVIWLDYGRMTCLKDVILRVLKSHGRVRSDMGAGCPERLDGAFLRFVWTFRRTSNAKIADRLRQRPSVLVLRAHSRHELNARLSDFLHS